MDKPQLNDRLTNGPLFSTMLKFSLPTICTGLLQLCFNAADLIVVGNFGSPNAVGAVGSTSSITTLLILMFLGLAVGVSATVSQAYGAKKADEVSRIVHTSVLISLLGGLGIAVFGLFTTTFFLKLMNTPAEIFGLSAAYMRIYFLGMPAQMLYTFASEIVKATGDTKHPLIILTSAGVLNVVLNLTFVIGFRLDVAGVAWATVISQYVSASLIAIMMMRSKDCIRIVPKKLKIYKSELFEILRIGLPAGIQSTLFGISNFIIQAAINSFGAPDSYGPSAIDGNSAAVNIENFVYTAMYAIHHTALTFVGQNYGAKKRRRIIKSIIYSLILVTSFGIVLALIVFALSPYLLEFYAPGDRVAQDFATLRLTLVMLPYFFCGIMDTLSGSMRGLGKAMPPMVIILTSVCVFRTVWIYTVFAANPTPEVLYSSYICSWILCDILQGAYLIKLKKQIINRIPE